MTVQCDHKPLEVIFQKPLASTTPRFQRMLLKLLRFNLRLSRAYLKSQPSVAEREIADDIEVIVHRAVSARQTGAKTEFNAK